MTLLVHHGSDLFNYDQQLCSSQILLNGEQAYTKVEYDEYVVYSRPSETPHEARQQSSEHHDETHVTHRFSQDDTSGATMLDLAFRHGFKVDPNVCFFVGLYS